MDSQPSEAAWICTYGLFQQGSVHFIFPLTKMVPIKVAIAISTAVVFKKSQCQSQSQSTKNHLGGLPGAPGPRTPQIVFWALALALALTFCKTMAMAMAMATLIVTFWGVL